MRTVLSLICLLTSAAIAAGQEPQEAAMPYSTVELINITDHVQIDAENQDEVSNGVEPPHDHESDQSSPFEGFGGFGGMGGGMGGIPPLEVFRIYVDGKFVGNSITGMYQRMPALRLTPGEHEIRVVGDAYEPWTQKITVLDYGNRQYLAMTLNRKPATAARETSKDGGHAHP